MYYIVALIIFPVLQKSASCKNNFRAGSIPDVSAAELRRLYHSLEKVQKEDRSPDATARRLSDKNYSGRVALGTSDSLAKTRSLHSPVWGLLSVTPCYGFPWADGRVCLVP